MIGAKTRSAVLYSFLCALVMVSTAQADCPAHSHPYLTTSEGHVTTVHCQCDTGFVMQGGGCSAAVAPPASAVRRFPRQLPAVRPGDMVTPVLYEAALKDCRRLAHTRELFQKKILQLQGWRNDTHRYQQEFEALRADALRGVFSDALDALPIEAIAKKVTTTAQGEAKLSAAFKTVQSVVSEAEGMIEPEDAERFKKIAEGELNLRESLLEIPLATENEQTKKWLGNFGKIYGSGVKLLAYGLDRRSGKTPRLSLETLSKTGELTGEVVGLYNPGVRVTVAVTKLGVRGAQAYSARKVISNLGDVLAQNWNAERHLANKIHQLTSFISEENRTIDAYRGVHPDAASCGV